MHSFVYPAILTPDEQDGGFVVTFRASPSPIGERDDAISLPIQMAAKAAISLPIYPRDRYYQSRTRRAITM